MKRRRAILVLGMHRSGTSVLTGMLAALGAFPGRRLIAADPSTNPTGFWEDEEIVRLNDGLLEYLGTRWDDCSVLPVDWMSQSFVRGARERMLSVVQREFEGRPLWVIKDPRLCRLLPLWTDVLAALDCRVDFLLCLRNPIEVAESLRQRNAFSVGGTPLY